MSESQCRKCSELRQHLKSCDFNNPGAGLEVDAERSRVLDHQRQAAILALSPTASCGDELRAEVERTRRDRGFFQRLERETAKDLESAEARVAELERERDDLKLGIENLYTNEGNYTLVARVIADHAATRMRNQIVERVKAKVEEYAKLRERARTVPYDRGERLAIQEETVEQLALEIATMEPRPEEV